MTRRLALSVSACTMVVAWWLVAVSAWGAGAAGAVDPDPAIYKHVAHLGWVVRDLDKTVAAWRALGVKDIREVGAQELPGVTYRGKTVTARLRKAVARFSNGTVHWIQPLGEGTAYADFLAAHGEGVQHLAFSVPTEARLAEELGRFKTVGVDVVQSGTWKGTAGTGRFAYLDTAREGGGLTVELEYNPDAAPAAPPSTANDEPFTRITQYAFAVKDVKQVSAYLERIGLGALPVDHNVSLDRVYRGKPGTFEMLLGWGRTTDVTFEWIQSLVGPNVYEEHLKEHGEGFHHFGFNVTDMDATLAALRARGLDVTMSGGWNSNGHEGRFAYLDTYKHGGVTVELLWNKPRVDGK